LTKNSSDAADLLRAVLFEGSYTLSPEADMMNMKKQERERRQSKAQRRAEESQSGNPKVRHDYWASQDQKHYLVKLATDRAGDKDIAGIRMHARSRRGLYGAQEGGRKLDEKALYSEKLTLFRKAPVDGKLIGEVQARWDSIKSQVELVEDWVGATIFFKAI
jgi:hypothetical protein